MKEDAGAMLSVEKDALLMMLSICLVLHVPATVLNCERKVLRSHTAYIWG